MGVVESGHQEASSVSVVLKAWSERYPPEQEGWGQQVAPLYADLRQVGVGVEAKPEPETEGRHRGASDVVYLLLGTGTVIHGLTMALKTWLDRPGERRLTLTVTRDGKVIDTVTFEGDRFDVAAVERIVVAAVGQDGDA